MRRFLCESEQYRVEAEYESVFLICKEDGVPRGQKEIIIGDFYGEPEAAAISPDETNVVIVGCGIILYRLSEPFQPYAYDTNSEQWTERFRERPNLRWINAVTWEGNACFSFTIESPEENAGTYRVLLPALAIEPLAS